jgi:hypothetical protein
MTREKIYDLYITDKEGKIILEERSIPVRTAERILREYSWSDSPRSHAQLWKQNTKFSFSIHSVGPIKKF